MICEIHVESIPKQGLLHVGFKDFVPFGEDTRVTWHQMFTIKVRPV